MSCRMTSLEKAHQHHIQLVVFLFLELTRPHVHIPHNRLQVLQPDRVDVGALVLFHSTKRVRNIDG